MSDIPLDQSDVQNPNILQVFSWIPVAGVIGASCVLCLGTFNDVRAIWEFVILASAFVLGTIVAGCGGALDIAFIERVSKQSQNASLTSAFDHRDVKKLCKGNQFIIGIYSAIGFYIVAYVYVTILMPGRLTVDWKYAIGHVGAFIAIVSMVFVTARYAAYNRLLLVLHALCEDFGRKDSQPAKFQDARKADLPGIQQAVYRLQTLYEPPGNVFVTIGIMGTFLGLAFGLTTLPLEKMMHAQKAADAVSQAAPFVQSMGLALGMSTTGVVASLAAHWLRGRSGPPVSVEDLIAASRRHCEAPNEAQKEEH